MFAFDEPFGSVTFCDDIRWEIGGKVSFIGAYQGIMFVPQFPATVPKFGIAVHFFEPTDMARRRNWPVPIKVLLPGDTLEKPAFAGEIPAPTFESWSSLPSATEDADVPKLLQIGIWVILSPMFLLMSGRIKVRADYKGDIVKLGSLRVEIPPKELSQVGPAIPQG